MQIEYFRRQNYGNINFYVKDPITKALIEELTGKKTITCYHINALVNLGFKMVEVIEN